MTSTLDVSNRLTTIQKCLNNYKHYSLVEIYRLYTEQESLMLWMLQHLEREDIWDVLNKVHQNSIPANHIAESQQ